MSRLDPVLRAARRLRLDLLALALIAFAPQFKTQHGLLTSDSKTYLYLDPGRFLGRAASLWDASFGGGTVPHQHIGYLAPMGPWFWIAEHLGVSDWVAQRLWWGTVMLGAGLGARWCLLRFGAGRLGAFAAALVYMLTPYQLAFTARMSVLLLAWAALPWMIGLTARALDDPATGVRAWRDPALLALLVTAAGGVNLSVLAFVLAGPALWVLGAAITRRVPWGRCGAFVARAAVLSLGVGAFWIAGLLTQARYGLPVLGVTETVRVANSVSSPDDLLRGLGNWFFYGGDRLGPAVEQLDWYVSDWFVRGASFAIPVVGLAALCGTRARTRSYFAGLVLLGVAVGTGAWPFERPTLFGRFWRWFADSSAIGLALRNTPRAAPLIVLGLAAGIALFIGTRTRAWARWGAAALTGVVAIAALMPALRYGFGSQSVRRPEAIPQYWLDAVAAVDAEGPTTRVLEIPGANFAAYRWGNSIEPVTPGLTDRPSIAREVLPFGSAATADLLNALDRRIQEGTFEPAALAPIARMFGAGTILVRSDLEYERYDGARPGVLWAALTEPAAPGLGEVAEYGPFIADAAAPRVGPVDAVAVRDAGVAAPPAVALMRLDEPGAIVRTAPVATPVIVAGSGEGLVDAAAAGLLDGREVVRYLASLDDDALAAALADGADLLLTDSHRRRVETWFGRIRDRLGATERAGQTLPEPNGEDFRLPVEEGAGDDSRSVAEHLGGSVDATGDGGTARPEDRAVHAFDGDLRTSWRVGGADPTAHRITLTLDTPRRADRVVIVQPQDGPRDRVLTQVTLDFGDGDPVVAPLDERSLDPEGQLVEFAPRDVQRVRIGLDATTTPGFDPALANAVGFAEVRFGDVEITEQVRLPVDLAARVGDDASGHRVAVLLSRLRYDPGATGRQDEELAIRRRFELPDARDFGISGTARVNPDVADDRLDEVMGTTPAEGTARASSHLDGDAAARASRALDGDRTTAWTADMGEQGGQWIEFGGRAVRELDRLRVRFVADAWHARPTRVAVLADGVTVGEFVVPPAGAGATISMERPFAAPVRARVWRLAVLAADGAPLPVGVAEWDVGGARAPADGRVDRRCRDDLLTIDGRRVAVRIEGTAADARRGWVVRGCEPVTLDAGGHALAASPGLDTGIDLDRIVLASDREGVARPAFALGNTAPTAPGVIVRAADPTGYDLELPGAGAPFWLVLAMSDNAGWTIEVDGGEAAPRSLVNGFANGWRVTPDGRGPVRIRLAWAPEDPVRWALWLSGASVLACVVIVVIGTRRRAPAGADEPELATIVVDDGAAPTARRLGGSAAHWVARAAVVLGTLVWTRPWMVLPAIVALEAATRARWARLLAGLASPVALVVARLAGQPEWAWLAVTLLGVVLAADWLAEGEAEGEAAPGPGAGAVGDAAALADAPPGA